MNKIVSVKETGELELDLRESRPSRQDAEAAVRTLLKWAGDDPDREGLVETPKRVVKAFEEYFSGYHQDPADVLSRTFENIEQYEDIVLLRDIRFETHCEHHLAPFVGLAHVAYIPKGRFAGLSKLARVVDIFAKRMQTQETMTAQILKALETHLKPKGVAVWLEAEHQCIACRGVHKPGVSCVTSIMTGAFRDDPAVERKFLHMIKAS